MKKSAKKIIASCLCAALAVSGITITAFALPQEAGQPDKKDETRAAAAAVEESAVSKDETVYVLAGADGSVQKIIVSDWLKNTLGAASLNDKSDLTNVENVKGDESFTPGDGNACIWDAQGNDIYYQGNTEKELPVSLSVTYKLDGKTVSPSELAGKSGKVTIRFDYTNRQYETVEINGQKEKIYVPFAMLTGVLLDNDVFTNVEVSNGKLINDGSRTAVIGIAFPGLQENLAISEDKLEIPDYVEITADAKEFKLGMSFTLAANELFSEMKLDGLDTFSGLNESMGALTGAMEQLLNGSSQLYDGLSALLDKSAGLVDGIDTLAAGSGELNAGTESLDTGAAALQSGTAQLCEALNTLTSNNESLNGGARQVFETLLATANTQLAAAGLNVPALTISNYADVLNGIIASLDETAAYEQALAAVTTAAREQVSAGVTQAVRDTVTEQVIGSVLNMDKASYDAAVAAGQIDGQTQAAIEAAVGQQMQSSTVEQMIAENTELQLQKAVSDAMASDEIRSQLAAAAEGAKSVVALKASLDSYNTFYLGLQTYTAGVSEVTAGAETLKAGTDELKDGAAKLYAGSSELHNGILTLKDGTPALIDGITQLRDGAMQLSDGLKEFNGQGIQKLTDAVDGDLEGLAAKLRATINAARNYKFFTDAGEGMDGQVKFIYRTDSIE